MYGQLIIWLFMNCSQKETRWSFLWLFLRLRSVSTTFFVHGKKKKKGKLKPKILVSYLQVSSKCSHYLLANNQEWPIELLVSSRPQMRLRIWETLIGRRVLWENEVTVMEADESSQLWSGTRRICWNYMFTKQFCAASTANLMGWCENKAFPTPNSSSVYQQLPRSSIIHMKQKNIKLTELAWHRLNCTKTLENTNMQSTQATTKIHCPHPQDNDTHGSWDRGY